MDTEKIRQFIIDLRKKNNLTQQELATKLGITYQAVSKWENGKSIPDIAILMRLSEFYDVSLDELLNIKPDRKTKKRTIKYILGWFAIFTLIILVVFVVNNKDQFEFRSLYTNNQAFSINGVIAFSKDKSSIYISNINYNHDDKEEYTVLECNLYQKNANTEIKISSCGNLDDKQEEGLELNELLKNISFKIDNYDNKCRSLKENNLYLEVNAKNKKNQIITYNIPLKLEEMCN